MSPRAALRNDRVRYGAVAATLHWLIAAAIVFMFFLGENMVDMDADPQRQIAMYQLHKSLGFTILALSIARLAWRLVNPQPALEGAVWWQRALARATHWGFYGLMIAIPVTGWMMVSASRFATSVPTQWFGLFQIPHLPWLVGLPRPERTAWESFARESHEILALAVMGLLVLHVLAALKHHFWDRDDVLARMTPFVNLRNRRP